MNISLPASVTSLFRRLRQYRVLLFGLFIALLYGYLVLQINQATGVQPDSSAETVAHTPHIDPALVKQLQQLQDNSVSIKALFNDARSNPFQ